MSTIIFISDGWGSKYGGINSFNFDLCLNLPLILDCENHKVVCITSGSSEKDRMLAEGKNLNLIELNDADFNRDTMIKKTQDYCFGNDIWWIGHDIKTGNLAAECAKATKSKIAIIHHMNYRAYYNFIVNDTEKSDEKEKRQKELFKIADVVFAVGPKLLKSANDILLQVNKKNNAIELIPGISNIEPINETLSQFNAITFGRLSMGESDVIKQCKLALASFAFACEKDKDFPCDDAGISLVGLDENEIKNINLELRKYASEFSDRMINAKGYKYTEDREDLFGLLKFSSVCLMLSIHEGFGLAGWEAISAGVPLIVSENSGLYEFLYNINKNLDVCSVDIKGNLSKGIASTDVNNVTKQLIEIKKNIKSYKQKAIALRNSLISDGYTWVNTAQNFLKGLNIESQITINKRNLLQKIKNELEIAFDSKVTNEKWKTICDEFECAIKYDKVRDAYKDIAEDIKCSNFLKVQGMRASTFCPESDNEITDILNKRKDDKSFTIEILLPYPFSPNIRKRLLTLPEYKDSERELIIHHQELFSTAKTFMKKKRYNTRFFESNLGFRLYFTKSHLYLSFYEDGIHAKNQNVYRFDSNSVSYRFLEIYYTSIWNISLSDLPGDPQNVSSEYRYVFDDKWPVKPSLVINICASCNMKCKYCPEGGENLISIDDKNYCDINKVSTLVKLFPDCGGNDVVRITGGEPLLNKLIRNRTNSVLKSAKKYKKIVLCTNAINFENAYKEAIELWESLKEKVLLKISFDTLNDQYFEELTGSSRDLLPTIISNIDFAKNKGFKIELNVVVKKQNVYEIPELFEFAKERDLVGIKLLTVNDFGGCIKLDADEQIFVENALQEIIKQMRKNGLEERNVHLNDGVGIQMKRFVSTTKSNKECTFTIVDHNVGKNSITPRRTFCEWCRQCEFYPCATGIMNLTLRADGALSQCRLKTENLFNIKDKSKAIIERQIKEMLEPFKSCFVCESEGEDDQV